jgi:ribosome-associated protein
MENSTIKRNKALYSAIKAAFTAKVSDVSLINLKKVSSITDYFLLGTCQSEAQMRAMSNNIRKTLSREGVKVIRWDYEPGVHWCVLDYGDFIIHLFEKTAREYYSLERLWADTDIKNLKPEDFNLQIDDTPDIEEDNDDEYL